MNELSLPGDLAEPLDVDGVAALNARILAGHAVNDDASLANDYRQGGLDALLRGEQDAACFLFTQAYVFALRAGLTNIADDLWTRLKAHDREA